MRVVQINRYGGSEVLEVRTAAEPSVGKDQVLVEVRAASINPFDVKLISGMFKEMIPLKWPFTPGGDFAGVVPRLLRLRSGQVRSGSPLRFEVGEEIYGSAAAVSGGSGSWGEMAAANKANTARKPKNIDFGEAAALPLVGSSAVQAVEEHIKLRENQKILIHGGAGGIGHVAIQVAKARGAFVATTVAPDDKEFVRELGADEVIDYKTQDFSEMLKDYDAVYDTVGGEVTVKSFGVLKKGGVLVSMLGEPDQDEAAKFGVVAVGQNTQVNTAHLDRVRELVESGKIDVRVDKVFSLEQIKEAFAYQQTGPRGKVVVKIKEG